MIADKLNKDPVYWNIYRTLAPAQTHCCTI